MGNEERKIGDCMSTVQVTQAVIPATAPKRSWFSEAFSLMAGIPCAVGIDALATSFLHKLGVNFPYGYISISLYLLIVIQIVGERFGSALGAEVKFIERLGRAFVGMLVFFTLTFFIFASHPGGISGRAFYQALLDNHGVIGAALSDADQTTICFGFAALVIVGYATASRRSSSKVLFRLLVAFILLRMTVMMVIPETATGLTNLRKPIDSGLRTAIDKNHEAIVKSVVDSLTGNSASQSKTANKPSDEQNKALREQNERIAALERANQSRNAQSSPAGGVSVGQPPTGYSSAATSFRVQRPPRALHPRTICQGTLCVTINAPCWHDAVNHVLCDGYFVSSRREQSSVPLTLDDSSIWEDAGRGMLGVGFAFDSFKFESGGSSVTIPPDTRAPFRISVSDKAETTTRTTLDLFVDWEKKSRVEFLFAGVPVLPQSAETVQ
jgi:hypothetical protein